MLKKPAPSLYPLLTLPVLFLAGCASQPIDNRQPPIPVVINQPQQPTVVKQAPTKRAPTVVVQEQTVIQATPQPAPQQAQPKYQQAQPPQKPHYNSFYDWKADFARRATASGYDSFAVQQLLNNAQMNSRVLSLDAGQPEFAKMPWEYADSAVSQGRVNRGQSKFAEQRDLLSRLEAQYGVDAQIIAAIWGMESSFGAVTGNTELPSALASLAYDGRRQEFAETQLLAMIDLIQRGDVYPSQLKGSWAGGMGQTQFIPATWLQHGVDGDGNGHRSPWSTADALASTANYLSNSGWVRGLAPFYEVQLPNNFDYSLVGTKQPFNQWRGLGVSSLGGNYIDTYTPLELWLPAGQDGPALLLSKNFDVIKVYNNSSNYALGVSLLGKAIARQGGLIKSWPRYEQPLSTTQVTNLQQRLTNAGYDTHGVDGVIGTNTRKAFARWQADNGQTPDGFITRRSAAALVW